VKAEPWLAVDRASPRSSASARGVDVRDSQSSPLWEWGLPLLGRAPTSRWPSDSGSSLRGASTLRGIRRESDHSLLSDASFLGGPEPDGGSGPGLVLGRNVLERTYVRCYQEGGPAPLAPLPWERTYVGCAGWEPGAWGRHLAGLADLVAENVRTPVRRLTTLAPEPPCTHFTFHHPLLTL